MTENDAQRWSDDARQRFAASSQALIDALVEHRRIVLAARPDDDRETLLDACEAVVDVAIGSSRDHWDLTEELSPMFPLEDFYRAEDVDEDEDEELPRAEDVGRVTVLYRRDYEIEDLERLRAAGRAAFLELQPDGEQRLTPEELEHNLGSVGFLLYQYAHARGVDALVDHESTGLGLLGGLTLYVDSSAEDLDPDDDDRDAFDVYGTVIYTESWA